MERIKALCNRNGELTIMPSPFVNTQSFTVVTGGRYMGYGDTPFEALVAAADNLAMEDAGKGVVLLPQ